MPSFCCVCKKVKQIGETDISFHKFPFHNQNLCEKWIDFVKRTSKDNCMNVRKITKFSSICSLHFEPSEILENGVNSRKSLRRQAVPTIHSSINKLSQQEPTEAENYEFCGLCRNLQRESSLIMVNENNLFTIKKCLPFVTFTSLLQKICCECSEILNTFSSFIDRVVVAQNISNQEISIDIPRSIKVEPLDMPQRLVHEEDLAPKPRTSTNQKKCEILEIVDIKPFNFLPFETNALTCEVTDQQNGQNDTNYEDEIQILSPKEFIKVEINDQDDGENEFESIKNYVYISTIFMHDHNYVKESNEGRNVKTEFNDDDPQMHSSRSISPYSVQEDVPLKFCCHKRFCSLKKYLLHKIVKHKETPKKYKCIACCKKFSNEKGLMYHKKFICVRINSKHLQKIKRNYQKIITDLKEKCTKRIRKKKARKTIFHCKYCPKTFKASKNLYQHHSTHKNAQYLCKICNKTFKMKHGLKQHIKGIHEKEKLFSCPICNHSFALKGDVKRCKHSDLKKQT